MATAHVVDLDNNDDLARVVQKCNRNFKLLLSRQTNGSNEVEAGLTSVYEYIDQSVDDLEEEMQLIKSAFVTEVSWNDNNDTLMRAKNGSNDAVHQFAHVATSGSYNDLDDTPTIPEGVSPYDGDIKMDGTKSPGSSSLFARGDHVHPTDTSRAANTDFVGSRWGGQPGTHGLVPAPPAKTGNAIGSKYFLLDDGYWHGGWMDLYFDSNEDEYVLRVRYMQSDGQTQATLWSCVIPAVTTTTRGMMRASDKVILDTLWNSGDYQSNWDQSDSTAADYIKNKPTIGAAAAKNIGSVTDGNTGLVTGDAVYDAIQGALSDVAGALVYKGTAATAAAISGTSYKKGWYWIASDTFALTSSINVEPGDMIIAKQDKTSTFANDIDVVQTNIDTLTDAEVTALWNAA